MKRLVLFLIILTAGFSYSQTFERVQIFGEVEYNETGHKKLEHRLRTTRDNPSDITFEPLFGYDTFGAGAMGTVNVVAYMPDHQMFWLSQLFDDHIYLMNIQGEIVETAELAASHELFGVTYDGTYIYGVSENDHITIIDPVNHVTAGEIYFDDPYLDDAIAITYDSDNDAFWVGDQYGNLTLFDRSGNTLNEIGAYQCGSFNTAGIAYDNISEGGPYLWTFDWNYGYNSPQTLNQLHIASKSYTGISHDVLQDFANGNGATDSASDLFLTTELFPGKIVLGGILWGAPLNYLFGYDIGDAGTMPGPGFADNPSPADNEVNVLVNNTPTVTWENPSGAEYNKVYFSESYIDVLTMDDEALVQNGAASTLYSEYDHGMLLYETNYFWRVVSVNTDGMNPGYVWSFKTELAPVPLNPTNVVSIWVESQNQVEISWDNPDFNINGAPVEIDSTIIYQDGLRIGSLTGDGESFTMTAPSSGIYHFGIRSYAGGFGSDMVTAPALGVGIYVLEFSRNNLGLEIPDGDYGGVTDEIVIDNFNGMVESVTVSIDTILHTWTGDLTLLLISPDGTIINLSEKNGGTGDNYIDTHFDDEAPMPITMGMAPFTGEFSPEEPLATFNDLPVQGAWKLKVFDNVNYDSGTLEAWTLTIISDEPMPNPGDVVWSAALNVKNAITGDRDLTFGEAVYATDGIDMEFGEDILPPLPPAGAFDARFELPLDPVEYSWVDIRDTMMNVRQWKVFVQGGMMGYPVELTWNPDDLPDGAFTLKDAFTGDMINVNMKETNSVMITNENITMLIIEKMDNLLWHTKIDIDNATGSGRELMFGEALFASDGIDHEFGEAILPPLPPADVFDVRFELPISPVEFSWIDIRDTSDYVIIWNILIQAGANGYPVEVSWDPESFGNGSYKLKDAFTGDLINVDMRLDSMVSITNENITALVIEKTEMMTMEMPIASGWQMISVPLLMGNMTPQEIFGQLDSPVFGFDGGYYETNIIDIGDGYWAKFPDQYSYTLVGEPMAHDQVMVEAGWNLIGVHEYYSMTDQITTEPAGIISSAIYGMDGSYYVADMLEPCKAYWVRTSQPGIIHLGGNSSPAKAAPGISIAPDWTKITLTAADGYSEVLYHAGESSDAYSLPPLPPAGVFDVRFGSDRFVEDLTAKTNIKMQGIQYPVTITVDGEDLSIDNGTGSILLRSGESMEITSGFLSVQTAEIPESFELSQNYPNPFNPGTKISFSLPQAENVKVIIYDQLGQKVTELVNGNMEAGKHEVEFNASNLASGLYFYRIQAGGFSAVKKMMLLK